MVSARQRERLKRRRARDNKPRAAPAEDGAVLSRLLTKAIKHGNLEDVRSLLDRGASAVVRSHLVHPPLRPGGAPGWWIVAKSSIYAPFLEHLEAEDARPPEASSSSLRARAAKLLARADRPPPPPP